MTTNRQHQHRANLEDHHGQWEANIEDQQVGSREEQALVNALAPTDNIARERWLGPMHNWNYLGIVREWKGQKSESWVCVCVLVVTVGEPSRCAPAF